ncbi:hypothetical protein ABKV19_025586 [Rosa sericea]
MRKRWKRKSLLRREEPNHPGREIKSKRTSFSAAWQGEQVDELCSCLPKQLKSTGKQIRHLKCLSSYISVFLVYFFEQLALNLARACPKGLTPLNISCSSELINFFFF